MNIEVASKVYWRELNYYDGILYCSLLDIGGKNDWRMPTYDEKMKYYLKRFTSWDNEDGEKCKDNLLSGCILWVIPVRNV